MSEIEAGADSIRKFLHELDIRIRARYPLIAINTFEEDRVREALIDLVFQDRHKEKPLYFWSRPSGLQKVSDPKEGLLSSPQTIGDTEDPESLLGFISEQKTGIFLLCDYAPYIYHMGRKIRCSFDDFVRSPGSSNPRKPQFSLSDRTFPN